MRTDKELFTLLASRIEGLYASDYTLNGICEYITELSDCQRDGITWHEKNQMDVVMKKYRYLAVDKFGASDITLYWWPLFERKQRIAFVDHLSQIL